MDHPSKSIAALIPAAQKGDDQALQALCKRIYPSVQRSVKHTLAREMNYRPGFGRALFSTGDMVQEVFLSVLQDLRDFRGQSEGALQRYISTLTKNRIIDAIRFYEASRRDRRRMEASATGRDVDWLSTSRDDPETLAMNQEQLLQFYRVLRSFSERDQNLLRERIENRLEFGQISRMLGYASADSTRKAFHVAQAKLLCRLERKFA